MIEVVTRVGIEAVPIRVKGELVDVRHFLLRRLAATKARLALVCWSGSPGSTGSAIYRPAPGH